MPTATATPSTRAALALCLLVSVVTAPLGSTQSLQDGRAQAQAVRGLLDEGRFSDAEQVASRLLPIGSAEALDNSADLDVGDLLVEALVRNGRGGERQTRQIAELIVRARKTRVGLKHPSLATSVRNLGDVLLDAGEYDAALEHLREALSLRSATSQPSAPDHANDLVHLAQAFAEIGKEEEALAAANAALDRQERGDSVNGLLLARTLRVRGGLYQRLAKYPEARADFQRAVDILEASHPTHPDKAAALTLLGYQLSVEGDLLRANELLTRAVSMATTTLRPDHPEIASAIGDLAANLQELGDLAASRVLREQAVDIAERVFGLEHPRVAIRLNNLANTCSLQGEYAAARRLYERAHTIYQTRFGPDHPGATTASFNLALLDSRLGDFRAARNGLQAVIASWQRVSGSSHPDVARAVAALAGVLAEEGLDRQAQRYFERALAIRERSLGPNHAYVARTVGAMASSLARLGEVSRASELAARAVRIYEASGAQEGLASALNSHAAIFAVGGNHAEAARAYERSLSIRLPLLGTAHPRVGETEIALAASRVHLNDARGALTGALRGDAINRNHSRLTLAYLSERQALDYASERPKGLDLALSLMSSEQQASEVLDAIVLGRSLVLDELAVRQRIAAGQRSELAPLWSELASARQRYANLVIRGPNEQRLAQHAALIDDARRAKEQAERKLAEQSAAFKSELQRPEISLKDVRANLLPGAALISFVRFNRSVFDEKVNRSNAASARPTTATSPRTIPSYVAFVLRPESDAPEVVHLGRADALDPLIARWRRELVAGITQPTATAQETERAVRAIGTGLRRKLWDPIAAHLEGVQRLYVVPDGAINLVPLTALPTLRGRYLLDDGPVVHYLSAERDLPVPNQSPARPGRGGLLAVGGPSFADGSVFAALSRPPAPGRTDKRDQDPCSRQPGIVNGVVPQRRHELRRFLVAPVPCFTGISPRSARSRHPLAGCRLTGAGQSGSAWPRCERGSDETARTRAKHPPPRDARILPWR